MGKNTQIISVRHINKYYWKLFKAYAKANKLKLWQVTNEAVARFLKDERFEVQYREKIKRK